MGVTVILVLSTLLVIASTLKDGPENDHPINLWQFANNWENQFYDLRSQNHIHQKKRPSPHALLASIDEKSIQNLGRFPWSRTVWAKLLDKLNSFGAKVVAFDIIFSEEETSCGDQLHPDVSFAQAIKRFSPGPDHVIVGYSKTRQSSISPKAFPETLYNHLLNTWQADETTLYPSFVQRSTFPIPQLVRANLSMGFIDMQNDRDGVFRNYTVAANIIGPQDLHEENPSQIFPSFGLLTYIKYKGDSVSLKMAPKGHPSWLITQKGTMELDAYGATKLRYRGGREAFLETSIWDILQTSPQDPEMRKLIQGKAIFVGATAFAAHDFRNSPIDTNLPGVFFHLNLLDMLSEGRFFRSPDEGLWITLLILFVGPLFILLMQRMQNAIVDIFSTLFIGGAAYFLDILYLLPEGYEIKLLFCLICFFALYLWNTTFNFYQVAQEKRQVKTIFSRYVSPILFMKS